MHVLFTGTLGQLPHRQLAKNQFIRKTENERNVEQTDGPTGGTTLGERKQHEPTWEHTHKIINKLLRRRSSTAGHRYLLHFTSRMY
jgi:hypothetical protein